MSAAFVHPAGDWAVAVYRESRTVGLHIQLKVSEGINQDFLFFFLFRYETFETCIPLCFVL